MIIVGCYLALAGLLLWIAIEDIRSLRIPDAASLPLVAIGLFFAWMSGALVSASIGAVAGYSFMVAVELLYRTFRGTDGLGRGDAKLFAAAGAWTGWQGLPTVLLIAAGSGLAYALIQGQKGAPMPFGPFLALGIAVTVFVAPLGP
jgi:prepilin signal peptidase PulO-like enzyme (type II secretory pathway)